MTKFFKKLRRANEDEQTKIKYLYCGEYGSENERPHYHAIIFNAKLETIQPAWDKGDIYYGKVENGSVIYSLKYMEKRMFRKRHGRDDRVPEFIMMSKGIGKQYLTKAMVNWHRNNGAMYSVIEEGKVIGMPRYYKDKIWTTEEREEVGYQQYLNFGQNKVSREREYEDSLARTRAKYHYSKSKSKL